MNIRVCTTIDVAPDRLWARLRRIEDHVQWMADARSITFVSSQREGVGTEFDCLTVVGPLRTTDRMVVTEWEPQHAMGIEHRGVVTGRGRFVLEPWPTGTHFCWDEELQFPWWMGGRAGAALGEPMLRAIWHRNLTRLKQLAETGD
jgi:polyketide cyclase/dehydrase/lipid transport protein